MQLNRWVQSHLSDEQFKNISLLPFRVTNKSGHTIVPEQSLPVKITVFSRQYSWNREDFANLVTIRCSREQFEQLEILNHITVLGQSSSGKESFENLYLPNYILIMNVFLGVFR